MASLLLPIVQWFLRWHSTGGGHEGHRYLNSPPDDDGDDDDDHDGDHDDDDHDDHDDGEVHVPVHENNGIDLVPANNYDVHMIYANTI